jgi:hypothetical protein
VSVRLVKDSTRDEEAPTRPAFVGDTVQLLPKPNHHTIAAAMRADVVTKVTRTGHDLVSPPHGRTTKGFPKSMPRPQQCLAAPPRDHGVILLPRTTPGNTVDVIAVTAIHAHARTLGITIADPVDLNTTI